MALLPLMQKWPLTTSSAKTICVVDGLFRLILESWNVVTPVVRFSALPIVPMLYCTHFFGRRSVSFDSRELEITLF